MKREVGNSTCMMARVKKRKNHSLQGTKQKGSRGKREAGNTSTA